MSDIWFAADLHLGHKGMIDGFADGRPGPRSHKFASIEQHDEAIVEQINSVVKPQDKLYLLGDIALSKAGLAKITMIQGHKRLIFGNHDQDKAKVYAAYFEKLAGAKVLEGMVLTHIPVHPCALTRRSMQVNVHGHLHDERVMTTKGSVMPYADPRYQCVSMEQIGYTPIHIDELKANFGSYLT